MNRFKFRVWDGELMHTVGELHWMVGGIKFYGPGVGQGWIGEGTRVLMQCTGLSDKNGKEIYEGDIIQSTCEIVNLVSDKNTGKFKIESYEVRWQEDEGRWGRWRNEKFELLYGLNKQYLLKWYEIIGNIYENPELLKGDK